MNFLGFGDSNDIGPVETLIGVGATLRGNLHSKRTVHVEGEFFGNIAGEDGIIVGEKGIVHGLLTARVVVVCGKVKGNIAGTERVKLYPNGEVIGDIVTPDLSVDDGAVYKGASRMKEGDA
jgi:cytoskeletal protein CcmA (bactofilin family)